MKSLKPEVLIGVALAAAVLTAVVVVVRIDTIGRKGSGLKEEFTYDVKSFQQTRPDLLQYKEAPWIETGLKEVRGLSVGPKDQVYVAGDKLVREFDENGTAQRDVRLADSPRCLGIGSNGTLYVGMKDHVEVLTPQGKREAVWKAVAPNALITSIAASNSGVFVADAGNRVVLRYDREGKLISRIGEKDPHKNAPGILLPSPYFDVAAASDGLLRVQDPGRHRIETYTLDGRYLSSWGKASMGIEGFCGCCNPSHFAMFPDGRYVTTEKGLPRVKVHDAKGNLQAVVAGTELFTEHTRGLDVAVDSRLRILVLDPVLKAVRVFVRSSP
ncbi:MAG: hypothetical protein HY318_07235 [Armatimonadetes bacterium]|nr:hypothetical protein [Armatimonadota bacterium]